MRFRTSGKNWEGRSWILTAGGVTLAREVEAIWPDKNPADGTVASRNHDYNNPNSDHRPRPFTGPGVVRALDVGENVEDDGEVFAEMLRELKDPRTKYVLHENRIFSSYPTSTRDPWEWAPLAIGHLGHVHVSFEDKADHDPRPWNLGGTDMASPGQKLMVDLAFNLFPEEVQGDPGFWKNLDENDPQWATAFAPAMSKGAQNLYLRVRDHDHPTGDHNHDGRYLKDVQGVT